MYLSLDYCKHNTSHTCSIVTEHFKTNSAKVRFGYRKSDFSFRTKDKREDIMELFVLTMPIQEHLSTDWFLNLTFLRSLKL